MKISNTVKKTISLDETMSNRIDLIARNRGISYSEVVKNAVYLFLSTQPEMTAVEVYHMQESIINLHLDGLLSLFSSTSLLGLSDKFSTCLYLCTGFSVRKKDKNRNEMMEQGIFKVLNLIYDWDINVYHNLLTEMDKKGRIKDRYFSKFPQMLHTCKKQDVYTIGLKEIITSKVNKDNEKPQAEETEAEYIKAGKMRKNDSR